MHPGISHLAETESSKGLIKLPPLPMTLRKRLTFLVLVASIPGIAVAVGLAANALTSQTGQTETSVRRLAALQAAQNNAVIESARIMLDALIGGRAFAEIERSECRAFIEDGLRGYRSFASLMLLNDKGDLVCGSKGDDRPWRLPGQDFLDETRASEGFTVGQYFIGRQGTPLIFAARPIREGDRFLGAMVVGIDLRWLASLAGTAELAHGGTVTALGAGGQVLFHFAAADDGGRQAESREPPPAEAAREQMAALGRGLVRGTNALGEPRVYGFDRTDRGGLVVAVGMPPYLLFARYGIALRDTLAAPLLVLLFASFAVWWGAEVFVTRWVRKLTRSIEKLGGGDLSARSNLPHRRHEVGRLAAAFDRMAERIQHDQQRLRAALAHRDTLLGELNHRIKNAFSLVRALAAQSLRHSSSLADFEPAFLGRLDALGRISALMVAESLEAVELRAVIDVTLAPHSRGDNLRFNGPDVPISLRTARTLSLALHELATNAAKHGALSTPKGHVDIDWEVAEGESGPRLILRWTESGGPSVHEPKARGFGCELIEGIVPHELRGTVQLAFRRDGVTCEIELPLVSQPERSGGGGTESESGT